MKFFGPCVVVHHAIILRCCVRGGTRGAVLLCGWVAIVFATRWVCYVINKELLPRQFSPVVAIL